MAESRGSFIMSSMTAATAPLRQKTTLSVLFAMSGCHMLNDVMQSLLASLYPLLKTNYSLDFVQIGFLTMTFQVTASLLQPGVGIVTDRWPMSYALPVGMTSTLAGLLLLSSAGSFAMLLVAASLIASARRSSTPKPRASPVRRRAVAMASRSRCFSWAAMPARRWGRSSPPSSSCPTASTASPGSPASRSSASPS